MSYRRVRGMGVMDYYGLLAQADLQNCSPLDSTCTSNNAAKEAAVEDLWAKYQSTGLPDGTKLTFTPQTTAQVLENYNPADPFNSGNVIDTRGIMQVAGVPQSWMPTPKPAITPPQSVSPAIQPAPGTPGGATVVNSSGASQPFSFASVMPAGFSFSQIPWWGWLLGGGAALYAFGGARGR